MEIKIASMMLVSSSDNQTEWKIHLLDGQVVMVLADFNDRTTVVQFQGQMVQIENTTDVRTAIIAAMDIIFGEEAQKGEKNDNEETERMDRNERE